jgi:cyclopropane-fatty-acyl-phospholipid synthase
VPVIEAVMSKILRSFLTRFIRVGNLEIQPASGKPFTVGDGSGAPVSLRFVDTSAQWQCLRDPELAFGELFMEQRLLVTRGTIYDALVIGASNLLLPGNPKWLEFIQATRTRFRRWRQRNTKTSAKQNVAHHYDIDGRIYDLFLDADKQYSCAYFEKPGDTLDDAQLAKKRHIAAKLLVEPGHRILDIGCGWGGMALYLAENCDASVTGVTLSEEQHAIARARAEEGGLSSRAEFLLKDYRDVKETFDRIVSVGMFEHVGLGYYDEYFRTVAKSLKPGGVALIHTIGNTGIPIPTNPWILKYIFPGGYVPAMSEMLPAIERAGLIVSDVEVLKLHYAETLRHWRERFMARRAEAAAIQDERFCRMWEFYLSITEASFRVGINVVFQFQLVKKVDAAPMTRDYIEAREQDLLGKELAKN